MEMKEQGGVISGLCRYPEKKMPALAELELTLRENFGIEGDHHADGGDRQISLVTVSEKEWMNAQEVQGFCFKKYKENILLDGVSLAGCREGDLLSCGEVVLELTSSIKSCHPELCKLAKEEKECILAGSSRFAKVKKGGVLKVGMPVEIKKTEKQTILIRKIKEGVLSEKYDEVAVEQDYEFVLQNGQTVCGTCTPTHVEEMILGSRYLLNDFSDEELKKYGLDQNNQEHLQSVNIQAIFEVAGNCFENPGSLFTDTGCAHSCALVYEGNVVCQMEDIGRYNALDKAIGYAIKHQIPLSKSYVFASGRISQEYLKKVTKAGMFMVASRAAVTKAAVDLAKQKNVTLVGFIRKNSGNIYNEGKVQLHE